LFKSRQNFPSDMSRRSGPALIRQTNRMAILHSIREIGPGSRSDIIKRIGLSPAAVSSVVEELLSDGLLVEGASIARLNGRRGRPITPLMLNPHAAYSLGITLRPFHRQLEIEGSWCDFAGEVSVTYSRLINNNADSQSILEAVIQALGSLSNDVPDKALIVAAGIGIPGIATTESIKFAPNLQFLEGNSFIEELCKQLPYPVYIENDVNLSVISELDLVPDLRQRRFAYLYISSGVGSGIAINGKQISGTGWVGEIGHINVPDANGRFKSLEELLGIDGYLSEALPVLGLAKDDWEALARLCSSGDRKAEMVINKYSANVYLALQILDAVADLDIVVIDFPSKTLFEHIENAVNELMIDSVLKTEIMFCNNEHHNCVRGAALNTLLMSVETLESKKRSDQQINNLPDKGVIA
jgi:predicted NBD/HSP70 family sugar kinase